jgi:hypothetical protein
VSVLVPQQVELQQLRQYLYFCTSKASKLSTSSSRRILSRRREAGRYASGAVPHPALASPYVTISQNTSAYVSICQYTSVYVSACCRGGAKQDETRPPHCHTLRRAAAYLYVYIRTYTRAAYTRIRTRIRAYMYAHIRGTSQQRGALCVCIYIDGRSGSQSRTTVPSCSASQALHRGICEHNRERVNCKQCGGVEHLRAQPPKKHVQAIRQVKHLRAQPSKKQLQAMRRGEHLRAQPPKKSLQAMRKV